MTPFSAELLGTALLILLGNGVVANVVLPRTKGHASGWVVIALGWGMAVFVAVWCVGEVSGAHLNPAVTVGLATAGKFAWADAPAYIAAQMLGAMLGAAAVSLTYFDHYRECRDGDAILATYSTAPAIRNAATNLATEAIGTFVLVLAVLLAAPTAVRGTAGAADAPLGLGPLGALPVGLLVLAIGLSLGGPTGYAINPARDLGPRIVHALVPWRQKQDSDWSYAWIPIVGPLVGAVVAALVAQASQAG